MSLQYIIDGYNLINNPGVSSRRRKPVDQRQALIDLVRNGRLCGSPRNSAAIVFDGYAGNARLAVGQGVSVVFSCDEEADTVIVRMVQKSPQAANLRVVSDDKQVRILARGYGARVVSVEEFLEPLEKRDENKRRRADSDPQLSFSQTEEINRELRKLWLK